ncbi:MAG: type II toxin-antitoxin system HicB family antitoxin [Deinococcota bacterium]|nr:type II toxin-antitoxin system HicB family antitoxin [Deinococcota bacterium]
MKFKVIITFDAQYQGYIVDVPELPGCMSQGKTFDEALDNIKDAIRGWLHTEEKKGFRYKPTDAETFLGEVTV